MDIIRWRRSRSSRWRPTAPPSIKAESRSKVRKGTLASILRKSRPGVRPNEHLEHSEGDVVFRHACKMGLEGIVSKRLGSRYKSGRSPDWLKFKNPEAPAVNRESEEDWAKMILTRPQTGGCNRLSLRGRSGYARAAHLKLNTRGNHDATSEADRPRGHGCGARQRPIAAGHQLF
jgi:hypothetical protein